MRWLPRTRGDRPDLAAAETARHMAPPHPRGSTPVRGNGDKVEQGSPAPAGIDPPAPAPSSRRGRLPRTRGDRPQPFSSRPMSPAAPPHPRGSTPTVPRFSSLIQGSPAPAGIDPGAGVADAESRRLPRTRGDRPRVGPRGQRLPGAPPHPRGSTPGGRRRLFAHWGSPAPAGIDPIDRLRKGLGIGLPRTRGDRPYYQGESYPAGVAPPHPRGSTRHRSGCG